MIRRLRGPGADDVRDIDRDLLIGRTDADVEIPDTEVSRRHAVLRPVPDGVEVEDVGSSNGTFIDGERLTAKRTLSQTATLRVGNTELKIEVQLPQVTRVRPAGVPAPDVTVRRPIAAPEVTVARPQPGAPGPPPDAPKPARQPAEPTPPPPEQPEQPVAPRSRRRNVALGAGGVLLCALAAVVLLLVLGGSSKKTTPGFQALTVGCTTAACAPTVKPNCPAHLPPIIHDGFPEPKMIFARNGVLDTSLRMSTADVTADGTTYTTGFEYNQQLPGPTLFICPGDKLIIHLYNDSPLPTNLHVHGLHVNPNGNGDDVFINVPPLTEHTYEYVIPTDQFPGFYWYHPHYHPYVEPEEAGGALGGIVVEGSLDNRFPNIPERLIEISGGNIRLKGQAQGTAASPATKTFTGQGLPPPIGVPPLLVNGATDPLLKIRPGQIQRWRILNGTADRLLDLEMPGVTFYVLAQDGVTLTNIRPMKQILIGPSSRVEVLVRGGPAGTYTLSALPFHPCDRGCNPLADPTTPKESLITMVSSGPVANDQLPTGPIGNPPDLRTLPVNVHRTIVFSQQPAVPGKKPLFYLDDETFNPNRVDITMKLNSVEEWTLTNPTTGAALEWHTFHIHQNPFQVVSINGKPLNYIDWQDNVTLAPGETVKILIHPIDFTGKFVFHCHVLFHEDNGMMATVQVVADPPAAEVNADRVLYLVPPVGQPAVAQSHSALDAYLLYCANLLARVGE
jgi:suppressor of ftsI